MIKLLLRRMGATLLAIIIFLEEFGWRPLSRLMAALGRLAPVAWLEKKITAAPRTVALLLFAAPAIALFPFKLLALWLIGTGHKGLGILLIVVAKLVGTALLGRLFVLTERQLMSYPWIARTVTWWVDLKARTLAKLCATRAWRLALLLRQRVARALKLR